MSVEVKCMWGLCEDVVIHVEKEPFFFALLEEPSRKDRYTHGCGESGQIQLTREQAREIGRQLLEAADKADELEEEYVRYEEELIKKETL